MEEHMGRPPIGKVAMTGAERTRLYRLKHATAKPRPKLSTDNAAATIDTLQKKLATAEARIAEQAAEVARLKDELYAARMESVGERFAPKRRAAKPKTEKPPLPPDEERERIIKGLRTRVRNLMSELHATREHAREVQSKTGGMDFQTMSALAKALHPDHKSSAAEWEALRDKAFKLFTAWKADSDKARRQAR
jgi:hypothetical protein